MKPWLPPDAQHRCSEDIHAKPKSKKIRRQAYLCNFAPYASLREIKSSEHLWLPDNNKCISCNKNICSNEGFTKPPTYFIPAAIFVFNTVHL